MSHPSMIHAPSSSPSGLRWQDQLRTSLIYIAWVQALIATLGSLYLSEIRGFPPCGLCWYQRIFMYPLVLILGIGIVRQDRYIRSYILPLSGIGLSIALYHNLLTYGVIAEPLLPCMAGISCTTRWINWFGFITIPFLSAVAFAIITIATALYHPMEDVHE